MLGHVAIAFLVAGIAAAIGYAVVRVTRRGSPGLLSWTIGILATCLVLVGSVVGDRIVQESVWRSSQPEMNGMTPMVGPSRGVLLLLVAFATAGYFVGWIYGERHSKKR